MFVGLPQEEATFQMEERAALFVGNGDSDKTVTLYTYMGDYMALRVEPLSVAEWMTLSDVVRDFERRRYYHQPC